MYEGDIPPRYPVPQVPPGTPVAFVPPRPYDYGDQVKPVFLHGF